MSLVKFEPTNVLESAIRDAKLGAYPVHEILDLLTRSDLCMSSRTEVLEDGSGFTPLLFEEGGNPLVATFSSLDRPALHRHLAEYVLQMPGKHVFLRTPPGYGLILNPGYDAQLIITPDKVRELGKGLAAN